MPDMGGQMLRVTLGNGGLTMIKYKVSDLSRALDWRYAMQSIQVMGRFHHLLLSRPPVPA